MLPERIARLQQKVQLLRQALQSVRGFVISGAPESPVIHLGYNRGERLACEALLQQVVEAAEVQDATYAPLLNFCLQARGVAITRSKYHPDELFVRPPSIRLTVSSGTPPFYSKSIAFAEPLLSSEHESKDIEYAAATLAEIVQSLKL